MDDSDGGNAFEAIRITNSGTIEGTGSNGVGIRIVSDRENCIFMEGGTITGAAARRWSWVPATMYFPIPAEQ
ncbi:MAG: hypothetical protein ACLT8E_00510 [Akkermansia sp.]